MAQKILIVEDEENYKQPLMKELSAVGYEIFGASDGEEALEIIDAEAIDLVLLDLVLPRMDGVEFLYTLRNSSGKNIPIIILTNVDQPVPHSGVAAFMLKANVSINDVVQKVQEILAGPPVLDGNTH